MNQGTGKQEKWVVLFRKSPHQVQELSVKSIDSEVTYLAVHPGSPICQQQDG